MSNEKTVEELIKMAKQETEVKHVSKRKLTEAHRFALANNIRHSDEHKVRSLAIYELYCEWKGKKPQPMNKFFMDFGKIFEKTKTSGVIYYKVDPEPFDLSDEAYWRERARYRKTSGKFKDEKKKKETN